MKGYLTKLFARVPEQSDIEPAEANVQTNSSIDVARIVWCINGLRRDFGRVPVVGEVGDCNERRNEDMRSTHTHTHTHTHIEPKMTKPTKMLMVSSR